MWWLCQRLLERSDVHAAYCLFISNPDRSVLMLQQRAGRKRDGLIVWDYHVVALAAVTSSSPSSTSAAGWYVLDVDSLLPFPCPLEAYLDASFPSAAAADVQPLFRLIPAAAYTAHFASDRSHMRREDGSWYVQPPSWPHIQPADKPAANNIQQYITMQQPQATVQHSDTAPYEGEQLDEEQYGRVLTIRQLAEALSGRQQQQPGAVETGVPVLSDRI